VEHAIALADLQMVATLVGADDVAANAPFVE